MSSPNISFETIPSGLRKPGQYMEFNTKLAVNSLPANVQRVILVGQRLTPPSAWEANHVYSAGDKIRPVVNNGHYYICTTAGTSGGTEPTWNTSHGSTTTDGATAIWTEYALADPNASSLTVYQLFSDVDAKNYFGEGSQLHLMAKAAIRAYPYLQLFAIALADNGANFGSGTFTVAGTAAGSGFIRVWIGDVSVEITFASTATAAAIATALCNAINQTADLPVIASVAAGVVTVKQKNSGVIGNQCKLAVEYTQGKSVTVTPVTTSGGTTNPDVQNALDKIAAEKYDIIVSAYNDSDSLASPTSLNKFKTHIDTVSGALEKKPGIVVTAAVDTVANQQTLADALNNGRITIATVKNSKTQPIKIAAAFAAIIASQDDPALPYNNLILTGIAVPDVADRYTRTEQETLLLNGITPLHVVSEQLAVVRAVSTYQSDVSLLDITSIRTLDYTRAAILARIEGRFPRSKLSTKTPSRVRSEILSVLLQLESLEIVENVLENKDGLIVERDLQDANQLNAKIPVDIVNGLHIFAGRIDMIL